MTGLLDAIARRGPWLMLLARTALFAFYQALIALVFLIVGSPEPWSRSVAWWPLAAIFANADTLGLLWLAARREGIRVWRLYGFDRSSAKRDLLWLLGAVVVSAPLAYLPNVWLARAFFADPATPLVTMFQPLPPWMLWTALALFPLTIALAELPAYYGYAMPRIRRRVGGVWWVPLLVGVAHALQHVTLPLVFDASFALWRFGMFLPFAVFLGYAIDRRPSLLPYLMVVHGLLDLQLPLMLLAVASGAQLW
ncbi:MAG: hypothetical protein IBX63_05145 [Coriobacteriia bacterium]|nr:hypothetical protein [Coriobacteriia bacterium]